MLTPEARKAKYERFKHVIAEPWDRSEAATFPLYTTDQPFNLDDYKSESQGHLPDIFVDFVRAQPDKLFLDLGCGYRGDVLFPNLLNVEVYPSRSADLIVEPTCTYPIRSATLDGIGCFAVLEHTRQPWVVVQEMRRMLRKGGKVFIDWPFLQPVHGYPSHFFNATRQGLKTVFEDEGFEVEILDTFHNQTVAYTVQWILGALNHNLPSDIRPELQKMKVSELMSMDVQGEKWWRWIKALPPAAQEELACGNSLVARKVA
jgi:SAM-dependent methyltransferase